MNRTSPILILAVVAVAFVAGILATVNAKDVEKNARVKEINANVRDGINLANRVLNSREANSFSKFAAEWNKRDRDYEIAKMATWKGVRVRWEGKITELSRTGTFFAMHPLAGPDVEAAVFLPDQQMLDKAWKVGDRVIAEGVVRSVSVLSVIVVDAKVSVRKRHNADANDLDRKFLAEAKPLNDVMDLAPQLRQKNWSAPSGSCVIASWISLLRWPGDPELNRKADEIRKRYGGGQSPGSMKPKFADMGIKYVVTTDGDWDLIEWAIRTRRGCAVAFPAGHMQNVVGITDSEVILLDNNRPQKFHNVALNTFKSRWDGWAFAIVYNPPPPVPQ